MGRFSPRAFFSVLVIGTDVGEGSISGEAFGFCIVADDLRVVLLGLCQ